jgi:magnesium transporter
MAKSESITNIIAKQLTYNAKERTTIFLEQQLPLRAAIFELLSPYVQQQIIADLSDEDLVNLLDALDLSRANTVLAQMRDQEKRERIIRRLKIELKSKAEEFLEFHAQASLKLINFNYLLLSADSTVEDAAEAMESHYAETKRFPEILIHDHGICIGEVLYGDLIREPNKTKLKKLVTPLDTLVYRASETEAIDLLTSTHSSKVVIKDTDESVIGLMYTDDARAIIKDQPAASLYEFAGVAESERPFDSVQHKIKHRYKWLIINLGTAFMAAFVVSSYQDTLDSLVILAMYLPVIAGMGGNAAAQTLAITVRGITLGEINLRNCWPAVKREIIAGAFHGAMTGLLVATIALIWNQSLWLGVVLALAMVINLMIAAAAGALVPLIMKKLGKDPASSATIFITTITDVCGFMVFLWLATSILL